MINKLIELSVRNKMIIGLFVIALIVWGGYSLKNLPIDAVPDITNNQVQIITLAPTLATQEVEKFITTPIEYAVSTIPDVIEKRSISRFGISVVTVVFKDEVDIYKARQLVGEKLQEAEDQIPKGIGRPELAPITTGLGEIYHYVLRTKPGYENKFSAMDLRTIQDWIVKRQFAGTPGVAEVSGWGGQLKQYEIALMPEKMNSLKVSFAEIFDAIEKNNGNTGGAYIEKGSNAYVIRGIGLMTSLEDIEKTVIRTNNEIPMLIRDVANVHYGSAIRYGAVTRNGHGEVVAGITLMLKGANSEQVIRNVKERIASIQKSLPEGVVIEPYIDRTELIDRAIDTVTKNLIEGGLIVIFVLIILLGNWRAGFIVASVIPLSMLFAIAMMKLFGVSGNLMSLGAIDFGLIVDGAVIIVESICHRITNSTKAIKNKLTQAEMDTEVEASAKKMMNSASFGQIIIFIVYLPILALVGIEGKMFRPMAETVSFAILGALILCLTYVPMMSALVISKNLHKHKKNISDKILEYIHRLYQPIILFALNRKKAVVALALSLLLISYAIFSRMGGEFIPTLEEGDFAIEAGLVQGASLNQSIESFTAAEKILKKFPEVKTAVSRIGTAEIATDPMPIERGDIMVVLKDKKEWTTASSKEELMEEMEKALSILPGIRFEISQPIQMRFNELMTGIRQDVAVKIYGEDLEILVQKANEASKIIETVKGVETPVIEKIRGLPQITVEYNRDKISQYGLSVDELNKTVEAAFAGRKVGSVYEGEMRFDMVVRLQNDYRQDIDDIKNLYISLPSGNQVPLSQVAEIQYKEGPAQISRDNAKRRVFVGFNVRGRDVESVVKEIQAKLDKDLKLPAGYFVTFGGQFQNLVEAKDRLSIALPVALLLIFILLFFACRSVLDAVLIFTAIPLSAIGGVFALWIRGMPFSISAGIGFIALFGVAVLNGIVLIGSLNQLKEEGWTDLRERVLEATKVRLRPVIMTASVASLGFLPMAISTSAGAEVQKPLATVVIGGLISATLLTLVVLPALYMLFSRDKKAGKRIIGVGAVLIFISLPFNSKAQSPESKSISLTEAINIALQNNPQYKVASLSVEQQKVLQKSAFDIGKTGLFYENEDLSPKESNGILKIGIAQSIEFPTVYTSQRTLQKNYTLLSEKALLLSKNELIRDVKSAYFKLLYETEKLKLIKQEDSIYSSSVQVAELRYKTGETGYLESLSTFARYKEIELELRQSQSEVNSALFDLQKLLNVETKFQPVTTEQLSLLTNSTELANSPIAEYYKQRINVAKSQVLVERNKLLPEFTGRYFNQKWYNSPDGYYGYSLSIAIPLWFFSSKGKIQAAKIGTKIAEAELQNSQNTIRTEFQVLMQQYKNLLEVINYYEVTGLKQANEILKVADQSYRLGEISYIEFAQGLAQASQIKRQFLNYKDQLNKTIISINYLLGQ